MKNGQVWEESIPPDMNLADQVLNEITEQPKPEKKLKSLKTSGKSSQQSDAKIPRDRSHLRVIK